MQEDAGNECQGEEDEEEDLERVGKKRLKTEKAMQLNEDGWGIRRE